MRQYIKEVGKHSSVYIVSNILTQAIGFFFLPLLTYYLSTDEYGIIGIVLQIVNVMTILLSLGMRNAWGRFFFDYEDRSIEQKSFFGNILSILIIFGIVTCSLLSILGKPLFEFIAPNIEFKPYILLGIWGSFFGLFYLLKLNLFRVRQQSIYYGILSISKFILIIGTTVILVVVFKKGALGRILSEFSVLLVFSIISILLLLKDVKFNLNFKQSFPAIKYGINLMPHALLTALLPLIDKLILNKYHDLGATGVYNIAYQFGTIMMIVVFSINTAWSPFFMKTAKEKGEDAKKIFSQLSTYYLAGILLFGLGLSFFSSELVALMTTKSYHSAAAAIPIFVFKYVISGMYFMSVVPLYYIKTSVKYVPIATYTSGIINIALNFLLIPKYGMFGAAWASVGFSLTNFLFTFFLAQKFYKIKYEYNRILILIILTLILLSAFYIIVYFKLGILISIFLKIILLALFFVSLYIFKFLRKSEIDNLKDIFSKIRKKYRK